MIEIRPIIGAPYSPKVHTSAKNQLRLQPPPRGTVEGRSALLRRPLWEELTGLDAAPLDREFDKGALDMSETERVGITPKSWTAQRHHGVLHLGKRWYVLTADIDEAGIARGVRLDGPYADHETAEAEVEKQRSQS